MAPAKKKIRLSNGGAAAVGDSEGVADPATKEDQKAEQRRSLFVRSLPASATSESLTELFSESYPIKHATAVIDATTKQCRGYGFVTFADADDAQRAKAEFDGHTLEGRKLRIEIAEPRHREADGTGSSDHVKPHLAKKQQEAPQASRLIVRNLPWTVSTSDQLSKLFLSYGKIKQAYIPNKGPGLMAGFGFVVMRGRKNAEKAMEGINGKEVDGRTLAVDWAVSKDVYQNLLKGGGDQNPDDGEQADVVAGNSDNIEVEDEVDGEDDSEDDIIDSENEDDVLEIGDEDQNVEDGGVDVQMDGEGTFDKSDDRSTTLFVRNLPFTCTDEDLEDHFSAFGNTRYARVVMDFGTERSKGTGFVCFYNKEDAEACLRGAPKRTLTSTSNDSKDTKAAPMSNSILQNEETDPSGKYTIDGRVLQVSKAVDKTEAGRLFQEGAAHRRKNKEDRRRLYLLSEGTLSSKSKLYESLSPSERTMREASAKQRKTLVEGNPSLHLSLTRLSIRNIPRSVNSKDLKALAREAVVGFATDVKGGTRNALSKEELARGGEEMQAAEKARKKAGKGVVKQAKVVFEGAGGSKVSEDSGAGRSRGYGFIEYFTHRNALMGLRWLNGHAIGYQVKDPQRSKASKEELQDRKKRLIVEFAIENAQVVMRRKDSEQKARERSSNAEADVALDGQAKHDRSKRIKIREPDSLKRKRGSDKAVRSSSGAERRISGKLLPKPSASKAQKPKDQQKKPVDEKLVKRNQIIGRKRAMRRVRKGTK
ncbi:RNA recognition motif-containing protein [Vermiconidia calcicola]|uniref:RNA recognition motif-containing protein n=1 Tax=Vermiconidia calcicola TaxID=1690605 RepID=A0ACC3NGI9_9PEZI|nr:RNA recognition motif-containing protein [Vermiconidia calcicola]